MASFQDYTALRPFILSNVRPTGVRIGAGAYGSVEEVVIAGAVCAAKRIHDIFLDNAEIPVAEVDRSRAQFVRECQLMSTLRHPNIVQFLGVCFLQGSRLPALVMERLVTSLHDLLDPNNTETDSPSSPNTSKPFFPLSLKCSILRNVACGLAYLHDQSPAVIHRDLSARNILLNSGMVAKIADLGVARVLPHMRAKATMTMAPGAGIYMPPEALEDKQEVEEDEEGKAKYDASIDVFSFGVVAIFILCQSFPCKLLAPTYPDEKRRVLGRSELERRWRYMRVIYDQLYRGHPLVQMIEKCLDFPDDRPHIHEVLRYIEEARALVRDHEYVEMHKLELIQALQAQHRQQIVESDLYSPVLTDGQKLAEAQQQLRQKEEELRSSEMERQVIREQLDISERNFTQERQQFQEMRQQDIELQQTMQREMAWAQQQLRQMEGQLQLREKDKQTLCQELRRKEAKLAEADQILSRKEQEIQIMKEQESKILQDNDMIQKTLRQKEEQLQTSEALVAEVLKHSEKQKDSKFPSLKTLPLQTHSNPLPIAVHSTPRKLTLQCHRKMHSAPCEMSRGSATTDGRFAFITQNDSSKVYAYEISTEKWEQLPSTPYASPGLIICGGVLVAAGGQSTNKVFAMNPSRPQWTQKHPPMNIARHSPAVVSTSDDNIIVIGGYFRPRVPTPVVELYKSSTRQWFQLKNLPEPLDELSATITSQNTLHVIGAKSSYSCALRTLQAAAYPSPYSQTWKPLPPLPVTHSTAATLCGELLIIGGRQNSSPVDSIYQLVEREWVKIGVMFTGRLQPLVVCPTPHKMVIVGGLEVATGRLIKQTKTTEECIVIQ